MSEWPGHGDAQADPDRPRRTRERLDPDHSPAAIGSPTSAYTDPSSHLDRSWKLDDITPD